jgi:Flp pilus assembly pilin Flp
MIGEANAMLVTLMLDASARVQARLRREEGQAFVEYALVMLLVGVALATGAFVGPFRSSLEAAFQAVQSALAKATTG